jgi:hypothetical protein
VACMRIAIAVYTLKRVICEGAILIEPVLSAPCSRRCWHIIILSFIRMYCAVFSADRRVVHFKQDT